MGVRPFPFLRANLLWMGQPLVQWFVRCGLTLDGATVDQMLHIEWVSEVRGESVDNSWVALCECFSNPLRGQLDLSIPNTPIQMQTHCTSSTFPTPVIML
eukprot:jgi/Botrbrau1/20025/Bobra.200_1s0031.1